MAKTRVRYVCSECDHSELRWMGRCPRCGAWNTMEEQVETPEEQKRERRQAAAAAVRKPQVLNQVRRDQHPRLPVGIGEVDRLLGGGLVTGSLVLCAGDPGIGKSTLSLIISREVAKRGPVLYVSGEESEAQTRLRADRLGEFPDELYVVSETNLEYIEQHIESMTPQLVIIDSIQTMFLPQYESAPGSMKQVRESIGTLLKIAKTSGITMWIVGQVTKESALAGPRTLEHMVDTVLHFEGQATGRLRLVRAIKNRFGSTDEVAMFEMVNSGLEEVANPSQHLLEERSERVAGSVVGASGKGARPIFTELQALVSPVPQGVTPRHTAIGVNRGRLELVAAVLQRWTDYNISFSNLFASTAGGFTTDDPALDLGMSLALASSQEDLCVNPRSVWFGEVTLTGEVRSVPDADRLVNEASRLGFEACITAARTVSQLGDTSGSLRLYGVETVGDALKLLRGGELGSRPRAGQLG